MNLFYKLKMYYYYKKYSKRKALVISKLSEDDVKHDSIIHFGMRCATDKFGIEHEEIYCCENKCWVDVGIYVDGEFLSNEELKEIFEN